MPTLLGIILVAAFIFAFIGALLFVVSLLDEAIEVKGYYCVCFIASAALFIARYYLKNPDSFDALIKTIAGN